MSRVRLTTAVCLLVCLTPRLGSAEEPQGGADAPGRVATVESIRRDSLAMRRTLLTSVLVEGLVSAVGGGLMLIPDADNQAWRFAGINTAAFGVANAIIGAIALVGIAAEEKLTLPQRADETEQEYAARLLRHALADERRESVGHAINLGLGVGYAAIGATAILASQFGVDDHERWLASGVAIAVQAAFLIVIDLWGTEASGCVHDRLLAQAFSTSAE